MKFRKFGKALGCGMALTATCALPVQAMAADTDDCISRKQITEVSMAILPSVAAQALTQCAAFLPPNATMLVKGPSTLEGYKAAAERVNESAGNTLKQFVRDALPDGVSGKAIVSVVEAVVADEMAGLFDAETCKYANNVWSPLAELSSYEMSSLLVSLLNALTDGERKKKEENKDGKPNDGADDSAAGNPFENLKICPYVAEA